MVAFESDYYKEIMRGMESIKGNWFAILNKRETVPGNCFDVPSSLAVLSQLGVLLMLCCAGRLLYPLTR